MKVETYYNAKEHVYGISAGRREHILELLPARQGKILDIGCAGGELAAILRGKGHRVWGVDISAKSVESAKKYLDESFVFDIEKKEWPASLSEHRFDAIVASEVIEHLFDPVAFLRRLENLLEPDGVIVVTTPNFLFWKNRLRMFLGKFEYSDQGLLDFGHVRFFSIMSLREYIRESSLVISREHHYYPNLEHRGLGFLGRYFPGLAAYQFIFQLAKVHAKLTIDDE